METLGCYYLHIFYPSHLYLKDQSPIIFEFDDKRFTVIIIKSLKSLMTNDFNNKIIGRTDEAGQRHHELTKTQIDIGKGAVVVEFEEDDGISYAIDTRKTLYTEFYNKDYTELVLFFETEKNNENVGIGRKALDYFIDCYRIVSGDVFTLSLSKTTYVSTVTKEYFYPYTADDLKMDSEVRNKVSREFKLGLKQFTVPFWNTQGKRLKTDKGKVTSELSNFFSEKEKNTTLQSFLLRAREELQVHNNCKFAFIEIWTALEVAIVGYLKSAKIAKGISKNKIDDFESEVAVSYLLNIELPLVHQNNDEYFKGLIGKVDSIRKLRNKVIHQNKEVRQADAENALSTALEFLDYMGILKVKKI